MRVLLFENDPCTSFSIEKYLSCEGVMCDTVNAAEDGIERTKLRNYDALIVDIVLNGPLNGCEAILQMRSAGFKMPILILSGLSSVDNKIKGLGYGADDYMVKPFKRGELLARLQAIIRRAKGHSESVIRFGPANKGRINIDSRTVYVDGYGNVNLTSKEYSILELLAIRKGSVISKENFLNHLYGGYEEPHVKIVDVFCCKTRKKLNQAFLYAKKAEIKKYKKLLESGQTNEAPELKGKSASAIKDYIEYLENMDVENSISTLWGRGYVLRDFDEKDNNSEEDSENNYFSFNDEEDNNDSDDNYSFFKDYANKSNIERNNVNKNAFFNTEKYTNNEEDWNNNTKTIPGYNANTQFSDNAYNNKNAKQPVYGKLDDNYWEKNKKSNEEEEVDS